MATQSNRVAPYRSSPPFPALLSENIIEPKKYSEHDGVFLFTNVSKLFFHKNSIQFMSGYGLQASNCESVKVTNCSYYHSVFCLKSGSGVVIFYGRSFHNSTANYTLELTYSNFTKCNNSQSGGGIQLQTNMLTNAPVKVIFSHLMVSHNRATLKGGCLWAILQGTNKISLEILNSYFFNCSAVRNGGGILLQSSATASITIKNTDFVENTVYGELVNLFTSELVLICKKDNEVNFSLLDSTIVHTKASHKVVYIFNCSQVTVYNTRLTMTNQKFAGFGTDHLNTLTITNSRFEGCYNLPSVLLMMSEQFNQVTINNSTFSNNTNGRSVITFYRTTGIIVNSSISDNSMTGVTVIENGVEFHGHNVIQNNRYTEGAGITLSLPGVIKIYGELYMVNNTAKHRGGAILVISLPKLSALHSTNSIASCSLYFFGSIIFSDNKAGKGGDDLYGATLLDCVAIVYNSVIFAKHIGQPNETSWYFDTPLKKYLQLTNTDRLSSMSSDPIMVCFCNNSNLPDCSDRTPRHIQTYPGLEINTSIATVGYYGGTSPGVVQVSAQHAKLVRFFGQNETTNCFQLHILLQNTSSSTALVDIKVEGGLKDWGLSLTVDILECPIGFMAMDQTSGLYQCKCVPLLTDNNVQCNVSLEPYKFLRKDNSWFAYINNTQQCVTGTRNCPFGYCNRSNVSFNIMAPDRQCLGNRTGILCGQCQSHLSIMLGSNCCGTCSNWYLFLLPLFALAGIVLVAVLMFLNLSVSVGTINGLLFYVNMVKLSDKDFSERRNFLLPKR